MPNWVVNKVQTNTDEDFIKLLNKTTSLIPGSIETVYYKDNCVSVPDLTYMDFNNIIPTPGYIYTGLLGRNEKNVYTKNNCWYKWNLDNWGCKWNATNATLDTKNRIVYFNTPWNGVPALMGILSQNINIPLEYTYANEDAGVCTGRFKFNNGRVESYNEYDNCSKDAFQTYLELWGDENGRLCVGMYNDGNYDIFEQPLRYRNPLYKVYKGNRIPSKVSIFEF